MISFPIWEFCVFFIFAEMTDVYADVVCEVMVIQVTVSFGYI